MESDIGKLVVRLGTGGLLLLHGIDKLLNGVDGIKDALAAHGLPEALAYGVYIGEIVAPLMVLLGLFARIGGGLIVVNMIAAVLLVHTDDVAAINTHGGYMLELEVFFLLGGFAVALLGAGRISTGGGRLN